MKIQKCAIAVGSIAILAGAGMVAMFLKKRKDEVDTTVPHHKLTNAHPVDDLNGVHTEQTPVNETGYELKAMWGGNVVTEMSRGTIAAVAYNAAVISSTKDKEKKASAFQELTRTLIGAGLLGAPYLLPDGKRLTEKGAYAYVTGLAVSIIETGSEAKRFGVQVPLRYNLHRHAFDVDGTVLSLVEG